MPSPDDLPYVPYPPHNSQVPSPPTLPPRYPTCSLLTRDPATRANAASALRHPWITEGVNSEVVLSSEIMTRLHEFTALTNLRKLLLNAVAKHMSSHDLDNLGGMFRSIDADGSGAISTKEFNEALEKAGYKLP